MNRAILTRARNETTEHLIRLAARRLFLSEGCSGASYTAIAELSGVSRPLVQRYFPKKELLVEDSVVAIRDASMQICDERLSLEGNPLVRLYLLGQVNIAAYFATEGVRAFMRDVLSSRKLTRLTIAEAFRWTVSHTLPEPPGDEGLPEPDELIMAMGGLYELLYTYLTDGRTPDVAACTQPSVLSFGAAFGIEAPREGLSAHALASSELASLAAQASKILLSEMCQLDSSKK